MEHVHLVRDTTFESLWNLVWGPCSSQVCTFENEGWCWRGHKAAPSQCRHYRERDNAGVIGKLWSIDVRCLTWIGVCQPIRMFQPHEYINLQRLGGFGILPNPRYIHLPLVQAIKDCLDMLWFHKETFVQECCCRILQCCMFILLVKCSDAS